MGGHGSKGHGYKRKKRDKVGAKFLRREEERMKMEKTNRRESVASAVEISATHSFGKSDSEHSDGYDAITALHDFRASIVSEKRYQLLMDRAVQRYCSLQSEVIGRIPKGTRVDIAQTRVEANLTRGQIVNLEKELAHLNGCWISMWGTGPNGGSDENTHAKWVVPIGAAADTNSTMTGGDDFVTVEEQNDMLAEIMAHAVSFEVDSDNRSEDDLAHRIFDDIRKEPSKDASLDPEQQETIAALEKLLVTQTDSKASLEESVDRTLQKKHTRVVSFTDSVTMKNKAHAESLTSESSAPNDKQIELLGEISQLRQEIRELQNIHNIQVKRQAEEAVRKRDAMSNPDNPDYAAVLKVNILIHACSRAIQELKEAQKSVRNVPPANVRTVQVEADVPGEKKVELIQEIEYLRSEIKELQTTRAEEASRKSDRSDIENYGAVLMAIRGLQETMIRLQKREPETVKIVVESPKSKTATPSPQSDQSVDTQPTRMKRDAHKSMKPRRKRRRHRGVAYSPRVREIPMQKYPPQAADTDVYIHPFPGGPPIKLEGIIPPMSPYMPMTTHAPVHAAPHPHAHHPRHHPPSRLRQKHSKDGLSRAIRRTTKIGSRSHPQSRRTSAGPSTYYEDAHDDPYAHDSRYYQSNRYKYVVSKLEE